MEGEIFLFFSGDIDAKEDKEGADERHPSETLVEEEQRGYRSKERIQIEVIGGREGAEVLQHQVPHHKADERSQYPQEEQITPNGRDQQPLQGEVPGLEEKDGQNGEQAVEKDFPRDENRAVAPLQLEDNQAIEGPKQRSSQGEQIAHGRELQDKVAVEHQESYAKQGNNRAGKQPGSPLLVGEKEARKERGDKRCGADDKGYVGGLRNAECRIFGQEIEATPRQSTQQQPSLIPPVVGHQPTRRDEPDAHVGHQETEQKNLLRT